MENGFRLRDSWHTATGIGKFVRPANYFHGMSVNGGDSQNTTLGEEEFVSQYIITHTNAKQRVYFVNKDVSHNKILEHIISPLYYFTDQANLQTSKNFIQNENVSGAASNASYFALFINSSKEINDFMQTGAQQFTIANSKSSGFLTIFQLVLKQ